MLDGRFRFDNYVVGSANRLAVAAARAVAESPGQVYNPLFIYSASGLGKTHLVSAIAHQARQQHPEFEAAYVTVDEFVEDLHDAVAQGALDPFKQRWRDYDLVLLDDVQFLTGQRETQNELLRLVNQLQLAGKQIVMACDRPPSDIPDVDARLVSRLSGGLVVDIGEPDYETKLGIVRNLAAGLEPPMSADVLDALARIDFANVRELQGAFNRLRAYQALADGTLHPGNLRDILGIRERRTPPGGNGVVVSGGSTSPRSTRIVERPEEFADFVEDVSRAVAESVAEWKLRITEAIATWANEGYRTAVLERALKLPKAPDVDGLLATFAAACAHLGALEREAITLAPGFANHSVFRDPERVAAAEALLARLRVGGEPLPGPDPKFTLESFVVGPSNQLAARAAESVGREPGRHFNPLVLYGPSGTGKTHLLHAVGNLLRERMDDTASVACVSASQFVEDLVEAAQQGELERWRARWRTVDALLLDDLDVVAGTERAQAELFHLFNALAAENKPMVFACDRSPPELEQVEPRLRSRLASGLVAALTPPDRAMRRVLYERQLADVRTRVPDDVLDFLADRSVVSVRELQGRASRVVALAGTVERLDVAAVRAELDGQLLPPAGAPRRLAQVAADPFFVDDERVIWDWHEIPGRAIEELR